MEDVGEKLPIYLLIKTVLNGESVIELSSVSPGLVCSSVEIRSLTHAVMWLDGIG